MVFDKQKEGKKRKVFEREGELEVKLDQKGKIKQKFMILIEFQEQNNQNLFKKPKIFNIDNFIQLKNQQFFNTSLAFDQEGQRR